MEWSCKWHLVKYNFFLWNLWARFWGYRIYFAARPIPLCKTWQLSTHRLPAWPLAPSLHLDSTLEVPWWLAWLEFVLGHNSHQLQGIHRHSYLCGGLHQPASVKLWTILTTFPVRNFNIVPVSVLVVSCLRKNRHIIKFKKCISLKQDALLANPGPSTSILQPALGKKQGARGTQWAMLCIKHFYCICGEILPEILGRKHLKTDSQIRLNWDNTPCRPRFLILKKPPFGEWKSPHLGHSK
jgi:hypothetical protein